MQNYPWKQRDRDSQNYAGACIAFRRAFGKRGRRETQAGGYANLNLRKIEAGCNIAIAIRDVARYLRVLGRVHFVLTPVLFVLLCRSPKIPVLQVLVTRYFPVFQVLCTT